MLAAAMLLILVATYSVIVAVLAQIIRRLGVPAGRAVFFSLLAFGLAAGILAARLWPLDSCILPNVFGVWLGDWVYARAIEWIGDPHSAIAHETIPWLVRIPQVYVITSIALCALLGLVLQRMIGTDNALASKR